MHPWLNFQDLRCLVDHKVNGGRPHFENLPGFVIPITRPLDQMEDFENLWRVWKIVPSTNRLNGRAYFEKLPGFEVPAITRPVD
jgi:hypothetical protein